MHPDSNLQPILPSTLTFTKKENGRYVLEVENQFFDIDEEVKLVLQILSHSDTYADATKQYINSTNEHCTEEEFTFYATEIVKKFNLNTKKKSFLLVEKVILSPKTAGKLATGIKWLFQPVLFWIFFTALVAFSIYQTFFLNNEEPTDTLEIRVLPFFLFYFITILFHELGHIAACNRFTGKNGGMGIGVYIIYPVFFSDISSIWHASKQQKIIANLAGIYMQLWFVPLFHLYGYWSGDHFFQDFSRMLVFICFIQILPFIRSDGYWLLSDVFDVPNLLQKSQENIRKLIQNPVLLIRSATKKELATLSYGLINTTFILFFAYYQLRYNWHALLDFPTYCWNFLLQIFSGKIAHLEFESQYVMVIVFYYLVFTYGKMLFRYFWKVSDQQ